MVGRQVAPSPRTLPKVHQSTGTDTDMASTARFFVVNTTNGQQYTRDGAFQLNSAHQLVTTAGGFVQGMVPIRKDTLSAIAGNITIP